MSPGLEPTKYNSVVINLVRLMRPRQWVKNAFVLAPLIFAGEFTDPNSIGRALSATLLFCLASSAAYIVNDLHDIDYDRLHPAISKSRPLASGQLSKANALGLLGVLYLVLALGYFRYPAVVTVILAYLVINLAYTFLLQYLPVIDIFTIAAGFVLRIYAGATALSVPVSSWMFVTTLCLALYLAAIKRRQRIVLHGSVLRGNASHYTVSLVERYAEMAGIGALLFYSLFVMNERPEMIITIPFVLFGIFRYWFVVESLDGGESPTDALLSDWQLTLTVLTWIGACLFSVWSGMN